MAKQPPPQLNADSLPKRIVSQKQNIASAGFFMDQAIQRSEQDELGISAFVSRLVRPLVDWPQGQSLVVGLYGPWGSGKTSVLNLVEERLKSAPTETQTEVVRFTPWLYSSTETLLRSFFETLSEATRSTPLLTDERRTSLATALDAIGKFVGPVFGAISAVYTGGLDVVGPGVSALNTATQAFLKGGEISFEKQKKLAASELCSLGSQQGLPARLVVLIDDLDRAEAPEVRAMLKLVRLIADLPNITYVLAIDYVRIQRLLVSEHETFGGSYLEKIIQIPISLPPISAQHLQTLLVEGVDALLRSAKYSEPSILARFRTRDLSFETLVLWRVRTLRDRARVLNSLRFLLLSGDARLDVDPVDALLISTLQTFYPEVLERVRNNKDFLTSPDTFEAHVRRLRAPDDNRLQIRRNALESIITGETTAVPESSTSSELLPDSSEDGYLFTVAGGTAASKHALRSLLTMLHALFPNALAGRISVPDAKLFRKENRIGIAERFDRYFTLGAPDEVGDTFVDVWLETVLDLLSTPAHDPESGAQATFDEISRLSIKKQASFVEKVSDRMDDIPSNVYPALARIIGIAGAAERVRTEHAAKLIQYMMTSTEYKIKYGTSSSKPDLIRIFAGVLDGYEVLLQRMQDGVDAAVAAGHGVTSWKRKRAEWVDSDTPSILDVSISRIAETALARMHDFVTGGGNVFEHPDFRGGQVVWRWRDLFRETDRPYTPIVRHLNGVLHREPHRLPALLGVFAGWSGDSPSLTYRESYHEIRNAVNQIFGWTSLLRSVITYRNGDHPRDPIHEHLVTEFETIVRNECAARRKLLDHPEAGTTG
jgi:hypothetical protein